MAQGQCGFLLWLFYHSGQGASTPCLQIVSILFCNGAGGGEPAGADGWNGPPQAERETGLRRHFLNRRFPGDRLTPPFRSVRFAKSEGLGTGVRLRRMLTELTDGLDYGIFAISRQGGHQSMGYFKKVWENLPAEERKRLSRTSPQCGTGHCRCGGKTIRGRWYPCNSTPYEKGRRRTQNKEN